MQLLDMNDLSKSLRRAARHRVLIVEDEFHAREYLKRLLAGEPRLTVVGEAADGASGATMIQTLSPDLVFLDIQMPELDGFEIIKRVGADHMPAFILVTAFSQHALRAFEFAALDYICKPFDIDRLTMSLQRFFKTRQPKAIEGVHLPDRRQAREIRRLPIKQTSGTTFVPVDEITSIEAANKYVVVRTRDRCYIVRRTIHSVVQELCPEPFVQIHRSLVVRKTAIREVRPLIHGDHSVMLEDDTEVTLSRNYRESFFAAMSL